MARIPAPKRTAEACTSIGGITVCPHVVYLTREQTKTVHQMHLKNVAAAGRSIKAAKAKTTKKQARKKRAEPASA
jgi:hypothetical protein